MVPKKRVKAYFHSMHIALFMMLLCISWAQSQYWLPYYFNPFVFGQKYALMCLSSCAVVSLSLGPFSQPRFSHLNSRSSQFHSDREAHKGNVGCPGQDRWGSGYKGSFKEGCFYSAASSPYSMCCRKLTPSWLSGPRDASGPTATRNLSKNQQPLSLLWKTCV